MLSIIIPFYNEKDNLQRLAGEIIQVLGELKEKYEIILVNDGSEDDFKLIHENHVRLMSHRKRFGKGKALLTGFKEAKGDVIVFMDADLQDNPHELPKFLDKIKKGYDFVNGWRRVRNDPFSKTVPSTLFNFFLGTFLNSPFHDINCGFKAMRRSVLDEIPLYGDNYRFLPIFAHKEGFKTTEVEIVHLPRLHGKSKYGAIRLFFGFLDTLTTYFVFEFSDKPLHFFGPVGLVTFLIGFIVSVVLLVQRIFYNVLLYRRPALSLAILLIIVGIQIIMTGIIGELIVYLDRKNKQ